MDVLCDLHAGSLCLKMVITKILKLTASETVDANDLVAMLASILDCVQNILRVSASGDGDYYVTRLEMALKLEAEGPLEIIGPDCIPLRGGTAGVWVRTVGEKGGGLLRVRGLGQVKELALTVE